ncbi:hypothetical protein [Maribacter aurantiacus]|uniref:Uncharacterized protein n=1 Tax=Maribacter aurantiacus TaxID=1882343 RepID=A0A5R8LUM4_9FLAO|nr:hypothetical protein [Maribacter aurantiacus]TLF40942.1 hypothetical protein FEK29_16690 [Maribacter aurantiacus]
MSKYLVVMSLLLINSCIPIRIAPSIEDYTISKGKKFKRQLPKRQMYIFEDPKQANEFYNYINIKYSLNDVDVWLDVPFTIEDKDFLFSFYEVEIPTKTVNLVPLAIDGVLHTAELDPVMGNLYETRKGNWYIAIEVYDQNYKDCLSAEFDYRKEIIEYLVLLKNEYLVTSNYNEVLFKD